MEILRSIARANTPRLLHTVATLRGGKGSFGGRLYADRAPDSCLPQLGGNEQRKAYGICVIEQMVHVASCMRIGWGERSLNSFKRFVWAQNFIMQKMAMKFPKNESEMNENNGTAFESTLTHT